MTSTATFCLTTFGTAGTEKLTQEVSVCVPLLPMVTVRVKHGGGGGAEEEEEEEG